MFPTTSSVDERLSQAAAEIEAADPRQRVAAGRVFRLPYARLRARAALQNPRRFNILEEFVLRAAAELSPAPTAAELATLFGLDPLFVDATLSQLESLKAVARGQSGAVTLTPQGRQFAKDGKALQPAEHKVLSLFYRAGLEDLQLWAAPVAAPSELPVLPGLLEGARQGLGVQAQAAVTPVAVIAATVAGGLGLHDPAQGRLLTGVDQIAVDDLGSFACGVLVVQSLLTGDGQLRAIDLDSQADWPELQACLDRWLKAGRVKTSDFLPPPIPLEIDLGSAARAASAALPEYQQRHRAELASGKRADGIELLPAGGEAARAAQWAQAIQHSLLFFVPRLTAATARPGLLSALDTLAGRGVITVIGWGAADEQEHEPAAPSPDVLDTLAQMRTPDGLPAALAWWVGGLYGQDAIADQASLASTLPNLLLDGATSAAVGQPAPAGVITYIVTAPDLVSTAVEDLERVLARAARQGWQAASRTPAAARQTLVAACQTWIAIRRPSEALSHLVKLAANLAEESPADMLVGWEVLTAICLSMSPLPAADLSDMGAPDALRRAIPEFLDWADSALPPTGETQPPFVAAFHDLLVRYSQLEPDDLPKLLAETRQLWAEVGQASGAAGLATAFAGPAATEPKPDKPKKRRY
jgi:hypothetical protein